MKNVDIDIYDENTKILQILRKDVKAIVDDLKLALNCEIESEKYENHYVKTY
jgi:hypothetical protein